MRTFDAKLGRRPLLTGAAAAATAALPLPTAARAQDAEPVKIGVIIGLTGSAAVAGNDSYAAMKLAAEEVNRAGGVLGRQITLIAEDDEGRPKSGVEAANKLADVDNVAACVGAYQSSIALPGRPGAEREGRGLGHRRHHQRSEDGRPLPVQHRRHRRAGGSPGRLRQGRQAQRDQAHRHLPEQSDRPGPRQGQREARRGARPASGCRPSSTSRARPTSAPSCRPWSAKAPMPS